MAVRGLLGIVVPARAVALTLFLVFLLQVSPFGVQGIAKKKKSTEIGVTCSSKLPDASSLLVSFLKDLNWDHVCGNIFPRDPPTKIESIDITGFKSSERSLHITVTGRHRDGITSTPTARLYFQGSGIPSHSPPPLALPSDLR